MELALIILLIVIIIFVVYLIKSKCSHSKEQFVCSSVLDAWPRYARISKSGGVMYISNKKPLETECKQVKCHPNMDKDIICYQC